MGDAAIFQVDSEGRVANWSLGAERIFGYKGKTIIGHNLTDLFPEGNMRETISSYLESSSDNSFVAETDCARNGGELFRAKLHVSSMPAETGEGRKYSIVVRDLSERKAVEKELKESELQLRSLAAHLQTVREEEKTKIARELHDEFGQMLTALRMDLSILERMVSNTVTDPLGKMSLFEKIGLISELLEKTIRSTRKIITELRPAVLDELGLSTAIQWQALEFENRTGIRCRIASLQHDLSLDQTTSTSIFRILQEALTNVERHSSATVVTLSLQAVGDNIILEIRDNGKGIGQDKTEDPSSTGILEMRERVLTLGGQFDIKSDLGQGATVTISVPHHVNQQHAGSIGNPKG